MVVIKDMIRPREDVLREGVEGRVDVYRAISGEGIEGNAERFLEVTYITEPLKEVLSEIKLKFRGERGSKGVYVFSGGFGSGKSHHVLALYHIFANPKIGNKWLKRQNVDFEVPTDVQSVLLQALNRNPDYLWEPIFEELGRPDLNERINRFPTHEDIKEAFGDRAVMIFLDEVEPWFDALKDEKLEDRNLNFIQNLIEVVSDSKTKACLFISILPPSLVRSQAISGKVNRDYVYWYNLYDIKDRDQIVLYRLFHVEDKKTNEEQIKGFINALISKYKQAGMFRDARVDTKRMLEEFKRKMFNSYPFHPQILDSLFEVYGSSSSYQRTRGILGLLSSVVRDLYDKNEIILLSDINPDKYPEIAKLDSDLAEKAIEDIRKTKELGIKESERILSVVFIKSIGTFEAQGAMKEDILFGTIETETNVNDIESGILDILNSAPHIDERNGKYILQKEVNILVLVENEARKLRNDIPKVQEKIASIIKREIKIDKIKTLCFEVDGIDDKNQTKLVFSLVEKNKGELNDIFGSKTYQNRIIFVNPKCKDVLKSNGISMNIARVLAIEQMIPNYDKFKKTLQRRYEQNIAEIKKKLKEKYGKIIQWQDSENFMPVSVEFDSGKILKKLEELYNLSMFKEKILLLLDKRDEGENLTVGDVKTHFYRTRGFPVVIDENLLKKSIDSLINDEKIVVVSGSDVYRKGKIMPILRDEYMIARPKEFPEEPEGVEVGPRETIRMRVFPSAMDEVAIPQSTEEHLTFKEGKVSASEPQGLEEFIFEEFNIEESKPWTLQSRIESELDESNKVREMSLTLKGKLNGKDVKEIIDQIIEKYEDDIKSMKLNAKVIKND